MKYMGSKSKIAKYILPIILKNRQENQYYVELFCGGCNSIDKVIGKRIASDFNPYLIAMWNGIVNNLYPNRNKIIDKELYSKYRTLYNTTAIYNLSDEEIFMIGWVGFMGSFNGRFFDGGYSGHNVGGRDYISEQIRNTESQIDKLKGCLFLNGRYNEIDIPDNSIIYCDIPYKDTKQYSYSKDFDHNKFWDWSRNMNRKGHSIFISEYNAPNDFNCIWSMQVTNSLNTTKTYKPIEKLFTLDRNNIKIESKQLTLF